MEKLKITSLKELKNWNINPTKEKPIVMEWYYDWIIDKCPKDYDSFCDAIETFADFTKICEKIEYMHALFLTIQNLGYWWNRASKWNSKRADRFKKHFNELVLSRFGV